MAVILDYVNIMLPHLNADDPVGFVIMLRSELEVKLLHNATFCIYMAAILKICNISNLYLSLLDSLTMKAWR